MNTWTALLLWLVPIVAADAFFPSVPAEVAVATGGSLAAEHRVDLVTVVLLSALGSWLGDAALYLLVKRSLSPLVDRWRWSRTVHHSVREAIQEFGQSAAYATVVGARFLPGGRLAGSAAAGLAHMPTRGYLLSDAVGGILWSAWMAGLGFATGSTTDLPFWASALVGAGLSTLLASAVAGILTVRRRRVSYPVPTPGTPPGLSVTSSIPGSDAPPSLPPPQPHESLGPTRSRRPFPRRRMPPRP